MEVRDFRDNLYKNQSPIEKIMETCLKRLNQYFEPQFVISPYIVDFFLPHYGIVVECDGKFHKEQKAYDERRDKFLKSKGYKVIHFEGWEFRDEYRVFDRLVDCLAYSKCKKSDRRIRYPELVKAELRDTHNQFASQIHSIAWNKRSSAPREKQGDHAISHQV